MHFSCHLVLFPDCSNNTKLPDRWNHVKTSTWSWIHVLPYFLQPTVGEGLQFSPGRRTARITLTGRRLSPASKRRRICCVESEMKTNTMTFHHSHDSLVSLLVVWLLFINRALRFLIITGNTQIYFSSTQVYTDADLLFYSYLPVMKLAPHLKWHLSCIYS